MRIVAGSLGGRTFDAPRGHRTHPMGEKVRGALFNALGDIKGLTVLDAFSGSGAIAFEAISRGVASVIAVEADKSAYQMILSNRELLAVSSERLSVYLKRCESWSRQRPHELFDIVIADPPYDMYAYNYLVNVRLAKHVRKGGTYVISIPPEHRPIHDQDFAKLSDLKMVQEKLHGDAQLLFYKKV